MKKVEYIPSDYDIKKYITFLYLQLTESYKDVIASMLKHDTNAKREALERFYTIAYALHRIVKPYLLSKRIAYNTKLDEIFTLYHIFRNANATNDSRILVLASLNVDEVYAEISNYLFALGITNVFIDKFKISSEL